MIGAGLRQIFLLNSALNADDGAPDWNLARGLGGGRGRGSADAWRTTQRIFSGTVALRRVLVSCEAAVEHPLEIITMAKIGTGRMSLLQRREIEAQIAAPLVKPS
jgi:hypothetical protein